MKRLLLISVALCLFVGADVSAATAAATLTSKNSVSFPFATSGYVDVSGVGCGISASVTFAAKVGAYNLKVTAPKVGDVADSGNVRVTSITADKNVATITAVADGPDICSPVDSELPPASIPWKATYKVEAEYDRRIQVPVRTDLALTSGYKFKLKPRTMWNVRGPLGEKFYGLSWRGFGSRKAVGKGRLRQLYCHSGDNCPQNRKRARIALSNPGYCEATGEYEYRHIRISVAGRLFTEIGDEKKNGGSLCHY